MDLSTKQEGIIYILIGLFGIVSRFKWKEADKQMNFDPVSGKERFNEKATYLKRNLYISAGVAVILYGFFLLVH